MQIIHAFLLILLIAAAHSQIKNYNQHHRHILNIMRQNEDLLMRVWIEKDNSIIYENEFELKYCLEQKEVIQNITVNLKDMSDNLTLYVSGFKIQPELREIWHQQRNLTRYQRIYKLKDEISGSYDPIDEIAVTKKDQKQQQDSDIKYALHVAKDFNIVYVFSNVAFLENQMIPDNFNLQIIRDQTSKRYKTSLDLTQFHIPFRTYNQIKEAQYEYNISLHIFPYDILKYSMFSQFGDPKKAFRSMGAMESLMELSLSEDDFDEIKEMLFTNHVYLVATYFILSFLQTILRFLTIKNEYQFWKDIEKNQGVSLKTLFFQLACSIILTLYLIQYSSSKLVIFFQILNFAITVWKLSKTFSLIFDKSFPFIHLQTSELYKKRQNIDSQAIWYMNYLLVPLMFIYLGYSLHSKNWQIKNYYTFFLDTSVAFIAIFGFILMTPQLYINYKLKSVEHLNWRVLIYRFINTIIDDLFALMITMPMMRRLMYFRDDIIFIGYIYQRFIYKVDYSRKAPQLGESKPQLKKD